MKRIMSIFMILGFIVLSFITVNADSNGATFFQHINYKGYKANLGAGTYTLSQLKSKGIYQNDISSLKVSKGYKVVIYNLNNFKGKSWTFTKDVKNFVAYGLNDKMSSVIIVKDSPKVTPTPTVKPSPTPTPTVKPTSTPTIITEVKSTAEDTIVVKFSSAINTTATFSVTGPMLVTTTVSWNELRTEATLKSAGVLLEGTYTIKLTAGGISNENNTTKLVVNKNGVATIEILGDKLIRTDSNKAEVIFKLTDLYGNDVTEKFVSDLNFASSRGTVRIKDAKKGIVEVNSMEPWLNYPSTPELLTLNIYSKETVANKITTATKVLSVTEISRVVTTTLSDVVLPSGSTAVILGKSDAGYLVITAKDQFGREVTDLNVINIANESNSIGEIFYSVGSENSINQNVKNAMTVVEEINTAGKKEFRLKLDLSGMDNINNVKQVTVQLVSKYRGTCSNTVFFDLKQSTKPYRLVLGYPTQVTAVGDTYNNTVVIPMIVYNEFGVQLTANEIADKATEFYLSGKVVTYLGISVEKSGENKGNLVGKLNNSPISSDAKGYNALTVQFKDSLPTSCIIDVKDKGEARIINFRQTPTSNLSQNSSTKFSYNIRDTYGRMMDSRMLTQSNLTNLDSSYRTAVRLTLSNSTQLSATILSNVTNITTSGVIVSDFNTISNNDDLLKVETYSESGSVILKAELIRIAIDSNGMDIDENGLLEGTQVSVIGTLSTCTKTFFIAGPDPSALTFEISAINPIKALTVGPGAGYDIDNTIATTPLLVNAAEVSNVYAKELKVTATDLTGNIYAVPNNRILSVASSDTNIANVAVDSFGKVMVYGLASGWQASDINTTKEVTITVQVVTDNEVKSISKKVTVSKIPAQVTEILFIDKPLLVADDELPSDYQIVREIIINDGSIFYIVTKDQYGIYRNSTASSLNVANLDKTTFSTIQYNGSKLDQTIQSTAVRSNSTIVLMYSENGASGTINMRTGSFGVEVLVR